MSKMISPLFLSLALTASCLGCSAATRRANARAESHVKYHAKRALDCKDKPLTATCTSQYKSGECHEFEVSGCDAKVVFRNVSGQGWTAGS
jgi:hypothetical protein